MTRSKIGDINRKNFSKRATSGKLDVIKQRCKFCCHHKAFDTPRGIRCTKCGRFKENE